MGTKYTMRLEQINTVGKHNLNQIIDAISQGQDLQGQPLTQETRETLERRFFNGLRSEYDVRPLLEDS